MQFRQENAVLGKEAKPLVPHVRITSYIVIVKTLYFV